MKSNRSKTSILRLLLLGSLALVLLTGCEGPDTQRRIQKLERENQFWKVLSLVLGGAALAAIGYRSVFRADPDDGKGGGGSSNNPRTSVPPSPSGSQRPTGPAADRPTTPVFTGPTPAPEPALNGCGKPDATKPTEGPSNGAVIAFPCPNPRNSARYYVLDGLNICLSYHLDRHFRIGTLLALITQLLRRGDGVECHFDASARYRAQEMGSLAEREAYQTLLRDFPEIFSEVPAGEPADSTILFRANSKTCPVISNDRFAKPTEDYRARYTWLKDEGSLVRGRRFRNRLLVEALNIDVATPPDAETALREFSKFHAELTAHQSPPSSLAA